uniref:BRCA1 associated RING domain 1 n=1 Tax=Eptatretus burgeri TaxID=7764 RepID=A0A8C4QBZ7_EPTBU
MGSCVPQPMENRPLQWDATKDALARLEKLLSCGLCNDLLQEPCCLGGCTHVFCRSCVAEHVGKTCPVCQNPCWVRDLCPNRQVDSIVQLCVQLRGILQDGSHDNCGTETGQKCPENKPFHKYFSTKGGKLQCYVKLTPPQGKENESTDSTSAAELGTPTPPSVFDFKGSPSPQKPLRARTRCRSAASRRVSIRRKLVSANKSCNVNKKGNASGYEGQDADAKKGNDDDGLTKAVSLVSDSDSVLIIDMLRAIDGNGNTHGGNEFVEDGSASKKEGLTSGGVILEPTTMGKENCSTQAHTNFLEPFAPLQDTKNVCTKKQVCVGRPGILSPGWSPFTPRSIEKVLNLSGRKCDSKRNKNGETALHVAAIKNELVKVKDLLCNGAEPNVKDYAGWTPLHEACNLGHMSIVKALLEAGARVNTPGYNNDSPLHDAVTNGHLHIATLLLQHGASLEARNSHGLRPIDCAVTQEMRTVLSISTEVSPTPLHLSTLQMFPSTPCSQDSGPVVFVASGLSLTQRASLYSLAQLLDAQVFRQFTLSVTHVVVISRLHPPCTLKCLRGILAGSWIVNYNWVLDCLANKKRLPEDEYEVRGVGMLLSGGPERGRLNKLHQLPGLFDGCFFFFTGVFNTHNKHELAALVKAGSGKVLNRRPRPESDVTQSENTVAYHAPPGSDATFCTHYVVYDKGGSAGVVRCGKVWTVPSSWLVECILSFSLLPVEQAMSI